MALLSMAVLLRGPPDVTLTSATSSAVLKLLTVTGAGDGGTNGYWAVVDTGLLMIGLGFTVALVRALVRVLR